jgi:plasmid maintenance system killer protein
MEIYAGESKLRRALEDEKVRQRVFGTNTAKKLAIRVTALEAADSLADFWPPNSGPERCHELQGKMAGTFSIDLNEPFRLLFRPIELNPPADRSDEQTRWESIKAIEIVAIEDTHG